MAALHPSLPVAVSENVLFFIITQISSLVLILIEQEIMDDVQL